MAQGTWECNWQDNLLLPARSKMLVSSLYVTLPQVHPTLQKSIANDFKMYSDLFQNIWSEIILLNWLIMLLVLRNVTCLMMIKLVSWYLVKLSQNKFTVSIVLSIFPTSDIITNTIKCPSICNIIFQCSDIIWRKTSWNKLNPSQYMMTVSKRVIFYSATAVQTKMSSSACGEDRLPDSRLGPG